MAITQKNPIPLHCGQSLPRVPDPSHGTHFTITSPKNPLIIPPPLQNGHGFFPVPPQVSHGTISTLPASPFRRASLMSPRPLPMSPKPLPVSPKPLPEDMRQTWEVVGRKQANGRAEGEMKSMGWRCEQGPEGEPEGRGPDEIPSRSCREVKREIDLKIKAEK